MFSRGVGMSKMGTEQGKILILIKNCSLGRIVFLKKKSDFGKHTRVEGRYNCETGAGA
jgi:hypothetical protein